MSDLAYLLTLVAAVSVAPLRRTGRRDSLASHRDGLAALRTAVGRARHDRSSRPPLAATPGRDPVRVRVVDAP